MDFEKVMNLCMRRAILFPSSEIYSDAPSGFWEYGHYGAAIKRRLIELWRESIVRRCDMLEIDGCVIMPKSVFQASGHLQSFADPLTECKKCMSVHRADKLIEEKTKRAVPEGLKPEELDKLLHENKIACPECGAPLSAVRKFNMMMKVGVGPVNAQEAYLRPETCQSIFVDFSRLFKVMKRGLPLGVAQVGNAFRNEISPRNAVLRSREFTQAEIEVYFNPRDTNAERFDEVVEYELNLKPVGEKNDFIKIAAKEAVRKKIIADKLVAYYMAVTQQFFEACGLPPDAMRFRQLDDDEKAFYASLAWDFEVLTSLGWLELVANNNRTDFDTAAHAKVSGKDLAVLDSKTSEKFVPHIWEISMGVDRILYSVLEHSLEEGKRTVLKLPLKLVPVDVAVFPLVNKDGLPEKAKEIFVALKSAGLTIEMETKDSIGKRYARADEIGIPFAATIDYDSLKNNDVTLRDRDSTRQVRVKAGKLADTIKNLIDGHATFEQL